VETLRPNTISNKSIWIQRNCCTTQKKIWKETRQQIISSHIQEVEEEHIWKKEMIQFELKKVSFSTLLSSLNKTTWYKYKKENIGLMGWDNFKNGYPRFSRNVCCMHWADHITRIGHWVLHYHTIVSRDDIKKAIPTVQGVFAWKYSAPGDFIISYNVTWRIFYCNSTKFYNHPKPHKKASLIIMESFEISQKLFKKI